MLFTLFGYWAGRGGGGGLPRDLVYNLLMQFFTRAAQKSKFSKLIFNHLKRPSKIFRECFRPWLCVFHPIWVLGRGGGGGSKRDCHTTCLCSFSPGQLKNRSFRNLFFIIENDRPRYLEHVLGRIYVFFTLFGYWVGAGGGSKRDWYTTCLCTFPSLYSSTIKVSETHFFDIVIT